MKYPTYAIVAITAVFALACNKQKAEIDDATDASKEAIDTRKAEVEADAKYEIEQTELNARIDKAKIEADRISAKAHLDAEKKKIEAEADAAKARLDATD